VSELDDKLNKILSSPEDMEKIAGLARTLSGSFGGGTSDGASAASDGGSGGESARSAQADAGGDGLSGLLGGLDPKMLKLIGRLTGEYSSDSGTADLLRALRPYLKDEKREQLDRAAEVARMARLAKIALSEFGGGNV
jgi:hypothetical protein